MGGRGWGLAVLLGLGLAGSASAAVPDLPACADHLRLSFKDGRKACLDRMPLGRLVPLQYSFPLHRIAPTSGYMSVAGVTGPPGSCPELVSFTPAPAGGQFPFVPASPFAVKMRSDNALQVCTDALQKQRAPEQCRCEILVENSTVVAADQDDERFADASAGPAAPREASPPPRAAGPRRLASSGSGFVVTARQVVTNHHVIDGCAEVEVRQGELGAAAVVTASAAGADLALLTTELPMGSAVSIRTTAALGEDVMAAGHPLAGLLGSDLIVTLGQVNSLAGLRNDPARFQFSAPVQPGNSGGPLLDRSGNVVGVVASKLDVMRMAKVTGDIAQNINFGIKPEVLRLFLDTNRVAYLKAGAAQARDNVALAEQARALTVQVLCRK